MAKAWVALIAWLCLACFADAAQTDTSKKRPVRPAWSELTPDQQKVLAPLQPEWDQLDATRRSKWVAIARRYPKMKPQEQQRLQQRMSEWARLTPAERKAARNRYRDLQKLPPKKRQEVTSEWERYQRSLLQQQRRHGAPLDPTLTDPPEREAPAGSSQDSAVSQ